MKGLFVSYLLAAATVHALPRKFEADLNTPESLLDQQEDASDYLEQFASPDRLHYRSEDVVAPNVEYPYREIAQMPSPPPASLPIAMPTGPFEPKFWTTATKAAPKKTLPPKSPLPMPTPGGPVGDKPLITDTEAPMDAEDYQQWLNSLAFGVFDAAPGPLVAADWQNAGFGPREAAVVTEPSGHLPVMMTTSAAQAAATPQSIAISDGTSLTVKATATVLSTLATATLKGANAVSTPFNSITLATAAPTAMSMMPDGEMDSDMPATATKAPPFILPVSMATSAGAPMPS